MGKSWKTTSAGITLIAGAVVTIIFSAKAGNLTEAVITSCITAILGGIGFLFAKDSNVTGGDIQQ